MNKIDVENLCVKYKTPNQTFEALKDLSFSVKSGEFVSIVGASGCGKSTFLSVLEGLLKPTSGRILIDGKEVKGTGTDRGVVFQHYSLFHWMTALKNTEFGIQQAKKQLSKKEVNKLANHFLDLVHLEQFKNKFPSQLSGGMQQRVAIARALAMDTDILIMDEPFGALDAKNKSSLQDLVLELWSTSGKNKTVIFVTHDIDEAILLSDKIVVFSENPGHVYKEIKVPFDRPRNRTDIRKTRDYETLRAELIDSLYGNVREPEFEFALAG